jgi:hypothetical protein
MKGLNIPKVTDQILFFNLIKVKGEVSSLKTVFLPLAVSGEETSF